MKRRGRASETVVGPLVPSAHETVVEGVRQGIETVITGPLSRTTSKTKIWQSAPYGRWDVNYKKVIFLCKEVFSDLAFLYKSFFGVGKS